ncbi:Rpn family recombination-promoting nuclease/putative transposase [Funiculus sociatus GB2-M2]|uniref:DUF2887 domain-containing protein n=1 Tax=Cyanophyceae TaxID=3028117 RepID=UPI00321F682B
MQLIVESEATAINRGKELILQAREELGDEVTRRKILELIETILLYKFTRLSREELAQMLEIDDEFRQTRMYQSIKQEGKIEGKLESVPGLLALGLSMEQIAGVLGLTVEQVQQASDNQSS